MNFTVTTIARSLAAHLAPVLPGVQMLEDMKVVIKWPYCRKTASIYRAALSLSLSLLYDSSRR